MARATRARRGHRAAPTGTEALARCLAALDLVHCTDEGADRPLPAPPARAGPGGPRGGPLGRRPSAPLAALSAVGIAVAVAAAWIVLRRVGLPEWRWGFLLVALSGPRLAYGNTTWGEMLATGLVTLLVAAALLPARPALVGLAAFGAGLTKETGYAFVVALGLLALLLARRRTGCPVRRHVLLGGAGLVLSVAVGAGLNLIRYGTPRNAYYLDPGLRTTSVEKALRGSRPASSSRRTAACSCSGPSRRSSSRLLLAVPVVRADRGATSWREAWPSPALLVVVAGLTVGLATWWAPFGWWAWGPRLSLPWVLPIVLVWPSPRSDRPLTPSSPARLTPVPASSRRRSPVVAALPHVGLVWRPRTIGDFFFRAETAVCPGGGRPRRPRTTLPPRADVDEAPDPARRARRRRDARRRRHRRPS